MEGLLSAGPTPQMRRQLEFTSRWLVGDLDAGLEDALGDDVTRPGDGQMSAVTLSSQ